ncbi:MAG: hypothetical protein HYT97_04365 [Elusimicrobia bacterium]|nr:hypothetical protein [Elusimicrobiota bacterium]
MANLREAIFYPPSLFFRFFEIPLAYQIFLFFHYYLCGIFSYFFAQAYGFRRLSSILFSTIFTFNGFLFLHSAYFNQFAGIIWLPALLIFFQRDFINSYCAILLISISLAIQFFSGNPFFVYLTLLFVFLFDLVLEFLNQSKLNESFFLKPLKRWLSIIILFLFLSAVQLFPFCELVRFSTRQGGMIFASSMLFSEPPKQFIRFLLSPLWSWQNFPIEGDLTITGFYIGIFSLALSLFGFKYFRKELRYFFSFVLLISIYLSFGIYAPGNYYLWAWIPGLKFLRFPSQWLFVAIFCFAVFSARGLQILKNNKIKWAVTFLILIELFLFAHKNPFGFVKRDFFHLRPSLIHEIRNQIKVFGRINHQKEGFGLGKEKLETQNDWLYAKSVMLPNLSVPYHIPSTQGYAVAETIWKYQLFDTLSDSQDLVRLWNIISASAFQMFYRKEKDRSLASYLNQKVLPYASSFNKASFYDSDEFLLRRIIDKKFNPYSEILISGKSNLITEKEISFRGIEDQPMLLNTIFKSINKREFKLPPTFNGQWLYLAECFYPGWKIYMDGLKKNPFRANFAFMAVGIDKNVKDITFLYLPFSFIMGLVLTLLSLFTAASIFFIKLKKRYES